MGSILSVVPPAPLSINEEAKAPVEIVARKKRLEPLQEKKEEEPTTKDALAWLEDYWKFV